MTIMLVSMICLPAGNKKPKHSPVSPRSKKSRIMRILDESSLVGVPWTRCPLAEASVGRSIPCTMRPWPMGLGTLGHTALSWVGSGRTVEAQPSIHYNRISWPVPRCCDAVHCQDTSVRDAMSNGHIVQGTHYLRDALSKGRIVQGTEHPRLFCLATRTSIGEKLYHVIE
jgi:hypothetical protein